MSSGDLTPRPSIPGPPLTRREREVLVLVAAGLSDPAIAVELTVASSTVKVHVGHLLRKLGARNRAHAVAIAIRTGELTAAGEPHAAPR